MFVLDFVPNATVEQMRERADKFYTISQCMQNKGK